MLCLIIYRLALGYGYYLQRAATVLVLLSLLATIPAHNAYEAGDFVPNSAVILVSEGWQSALHSDNPALAWTTNSPAGQDWETFNRYAYGFDIVIPLIEFGQTEAWAPSTSRGIWGWHLWWLKSILAGLGWVFTTIIVTAIPGLIRRD